MSNISIIAAMARNRVIGKNNQLPGWKIPGDLKRFRLLTEGKVVLMGRKTFESIGKPLPNRWNIVISSTMDNRRGDIWVVRSFEEALVKAEHLNPGGEVMVIGGAQLYKRALPFASRMYLTYLNERWEGDTFFPKPKEQNWTVLEHEFHGNHSFFTFEREVNSEANVNYNVSKGIKQMGDYEELGRSVGALVDVKNKAYGSAFDDAGEFLTILYPNGIRPDQYGDALALVRIFDKMKRIATDKDALGESPYRDIAGYGLLGFMRVERSRLKNKENFEKALNVLGTKYGVDANGSPVEE